MQLLRLRENSVPEWPQTEHLAEIADERGPSLAPVPPSSQASASRHHGTQRRWDIAPYRTIIYAAQSSERRLRILTNPAPATTLEMACCVCSRSQQYRAVRRDARNGIGLLARLRRAGSHRYASTKRPVSRNRKPWRQCMARPCKFVRPLAHRQACAAHPVMSIHVRGHHSARLRRPWSAHAPDQAQPRGIRVP